MEIFSTTHDPETLSTVETHGVGCIERDLRVLASDLDGWADAVEGGRVVLALEAALRKAAKLLERYADDLRPLADADDEREALRSALRALYDDRPTDWFTRDTVEGLLPDLPVVPGTLADRQAHAEALLVLRDVLAKPRSEWTAEDEAALAGFAARWPDVAPKWAPEGPPGSVYATANIEPGGPGRMIPWGSLVRRGVDLSEADFDALLAGGALSTERPFVPPPAPSPDEVAEL